MFLYCTRGLVRWVGSVHCGDMGAMKAEGQARLDPPEVLAMHIQIIAARHSNAAASQQPESKGFPVRRKAATKEQSSTHAAKQERTLRRSRTPATVETSSTRDPTESIAICVLVIAHHP